MQSMCKGLHSKLPEQTALHWPLLFYWILWQSQYSTSQLYKYRKFIWQCNVRCEIICQGEHTCFSLLWVDSTGCFVIPFSQLSENLSGALSPNLSPGGAPRPMLSLKMDTKSRKVGAGWGDGWGLGGVRILLSGQKSDEGSATRGL